MVKEFNFDIWRLQAQSNVRGLLDALKSPDSALRQRAAMALRVMGSASALPSLQDALLAETHKETRDIIIATLESLFSQEQAEGSEPSHSGSQVVQFIARLNSSNAEHAIRAAQGLGDIQEKLAVEALMVTFNNRQLAARVRLAAAEALIRLQSATADISLLAALRSERWSVRRSAAAVLGQMDADWAVEPLVKALHDPYEVVRRMARAALERIATPEAKRALEAVMDVEVEAPPPLAPDSAQVSTSEAFPVITRSIAPAAPPSTPLVPAETTTVIQPAEKVIESSRVNVPDKPAITPASPAPTAENISKALTPPVPTLRQAQSGTSPLPTFGGLRQQSEGEKNTLPSSRNSLSDKLSIAASAAAVPEVKTVIQPVEPSREVLLPAALAAPSSAVTAVILPPVVPPPTAATPTSVKDALVATVSPLDLPEKLPPPNEEDTRPTTPVPDDVS